MKLNKRYLKSNEAITLIALVITIIVLLVLAGITIASLTGNNGIISKSGQAKNVSEIANEKEELEVEVIRFSDKRGNLDPDKVVNGLNKDIKNLKEATNTDGKFPVKVEYKNGHKYQITEDGDIFISVDAGDTAPSDSNAVYTSGNYTAVIPAGFTVSATESSIENGLVVIDGSANEWVWVPVSSADLAKMYTEDTTGWNMLRTSVNTKLKTKELTTQNTFKLGSRELPRTNPGTTADPYYREPDVVSEYDINPTYLDQAGFKNIEDMATKLKDDYKDMIDSVRENGGFYIGRYELGKDSSNNPQVKAGTVMNNTNWYNLYSACKSFSSGKVESRMIWGCQWDQVCRFIRTAKDTSNNTISLNNSTNYGNYSGSTDYKTGTRNNCITNNIYDLAGNCWEWTQEAYSTNYRAGRGRMVKTEMVLKVQFQVVVMHILISLIVFS